MCGPAVRAPVRRGPALGQADLAVDVLVEQVAERTRAAGGATGLRAEGPEPHEVAGLDFHPVVVEAVDGFALQDEESVFHHVGFGEGDGRPGLERDDVDVHVVGEVVGVHEAGGGPGAVGVRHGPGSTSWSRVTKDLAVKPSRGS